MDGAGAVAFCGTGAARLACGAILQQPAGVPRRLQVWCPFWQHAICSVDVRLAASTQVAHSDQPRVIASRNTIGRAARHLFSRVLIVPRGLPTP